MKKIVATAYAINPYKGSEDGTGWQYALQIARFNHLTIYTRLNNQEDIERYIRENPTIEGRDRITFKYFDTPYYLRFWKKGGRGALLYFYLWQFCIARFIKKTELDFDIIHNLNFHNNWTPTFLWILGKPLVWGPVAYHPMIPSNYTKNFSIVERVKNRLRWILKNVFWKFDPFLKLATRKAKIVIAPNREALELLKVSQEKRRLMVSVASEEHGLKIEKTHNTTFKVLSVGRFVNLKGFDISLKAFHVLCQKLTEQKRKEVKLILIGKGPMRNDLLNLIHQLELEENVELIEWLPRDELQQHYEKANVFLFPSHEGAGMVVPEALSYGNPVLCFDNIGPGVMIDNTCGLKVSYGGYEKSVVEFGGHLYRLFKDRNLLKQLSIGAFDKFKNDFTWHKKGEILKSIYENIN